MFTFILRCVLAKYNRYVHIQQILSLHIMQYIVLFQGMLILVCTIKILFFLKMSWSKYSMYDVFLFKVSQCKYLSLVISTLANKISIWTFLMLYSVLELYPMNILFFLILLDKSPNLGFQSWNN